MVPLELARARSCLRQSLSVYGWVAGFQRAPASVRVLLCFGNTHRRLPHAIETIIRGGWADLDEDGPALVSALRRKEDLLAFFSHARSTFKEHLIGTFSVLAACMGPARRRSACWPLPHGLLGRPLSILRLRRPERDRPERAARIDRRGGRGAHVVVWHGVPWPAARSGSSA